jgi:hypothetical protein
MLALIVQRDNTCDHVCGDIRKGQSEGGDPALLVSGNSPLGCSCRLQVGIITERTQSPDRHVAVKERDGSGPKLSSFNSVRESSAEPDTSHYRIALSRYWFRVVSGFKPPADQGCKKKLLPSTVRRLKNDLKKFTQSYISSSASNLDRPVYEALGVIAGTAETPYTETLSGIVRREGRIS